MAPEMVLRQGYDFKARNIGFVEMWSFHSQNLLADRHVEPGCHLLYGDAWDAPGPGSQYLRRSTGNSIRSQRLNRVGDHVTVCRIFQGWKAKDECECISDAMTYGSWTTPHSSVMGCECKMKHCLDITAELELTMLLACTTSGIPTFKHFCAMTAKSLHTLQHLIHRRIRPQEMKEAIKSPNATKASMMNAMTKVL